MINTDHGKNPTKLFEEWIYMCGRYTVFTEEENIEIKEILNEVNRKFGYTKDDVKQMKTGEIFPTNNVPIVTGESGITLLKWGFPNFRQPSAVIINARSETLAEKPMFKRLIDSKRCLVPSSGFYEWKAVEGMSKKVKHLIRLKDKGFMYMGGLYNTFKDQDGNPYTSFVIVTTDANKKMSEVHDRMPVLMDKEKSTVWLKGSFSEASELFDQRDVALEIKAVG